SNRYYNQRRKCWPGSPALAKRRLNSRRQSILNFLPDSPFVISSSISIKQFFYSMKSEPIIVIGAGVSGLTSATVLQILGYNTRIIAKNTYQSVDNKEEHPEFASLFPAASIIPHATYSEQLSALFKHSQSFFSTLYEKHFPGVDIHKHFEIFEEPREWPIYQKWMQGFKSIENADSAVPRPAYADPVFGWEFICLFVEWPRYFSALTDLYRKLGGAIKQHSLRAEDISNLPSQTIINCSGVGTASLFEDPGDEQRIMRGHLLHKEGAKPLTNHEGMSISYNYTPRSAIYSSANGKACDVYLYPRQDGWVIGGSREPGHLVNGEFEPSAIDQNLKHYHINSYAIPAP